MKPLVDLSASGRGRPSISADVIASVMVLQALHGLSDRQTAEAVVFDLRREEAACGFAVTETGFHLSVLTYWWRRVAASARPHRIFEMASDEVSATGVPAGKMRRALDSTIVDDAVARQDTVAQLIAQIRLVGALVPAAGVMIAGLDGYDSTTGAKPDIAWDDPGPRDLLASALVTDALAVLNRLQGVELNRKQSEAVALLALVAGPYVEPAEGSDGTDGRCRIARKVAPDRVISTVDPQIRHAHKSREKKQAQPVEHQRRGAGEQDLPLQRIGRAISGAVFADLLVRVDNLGEFLLNAGNFFDMVRLLAGVLITTILGFLAIEAANRVEWWVLPWQRGRSGH